MNQERLLCTNPPAKDAHKRRILLPILIMVLTLSCHENQPETREKPVPRKQAQLRISAASGLVIRTGPARTNEKAGSIAFNEIADIVDAESGPSDTIEEKTGKWIKIRYKDVEGWIFSGFAEFISSTGTENSGAGADDFVLRGSCITIEKRYTYKEIKDRLPFGFKEITSNSELKIVDSDFTVTMEKHNYDYVLSTIEFKGKKKLLSGIARGMTKDMVMALIGPPQKSDGQEDLYSYSKEGLSVNCVFSYSGTKLDKIVWNVL